MQSPVLQAIRPDWQNKSCVVAATGPSLTEDVADAVMASGLPVVACQDAYRRIPTADILYGCDAKWWHASKGCMDFAGERWSSHDDKNSANLKGEVQEQYGVKLIQGKPGNQFSRDGRYIYYGDNSGFQSLNIAILKGCHYIILVGFNMGGKGHFFGDHPAPLFNQENYSRWCKNFDRARADLDKSIEVVNCTIGSALTCFPTEKLLDALEHGRLYWNRPQSYAATG